MAIIERSLFDLLCSTGMLSVLIRILDEAILMGTHNIQFHDKMR